KSILHHRKVRLKTSKFHHQVEDTVEKSISFGRAAKIPPIYERSTASNISIEKGGDLIVLSSCNRQPRLSSASHGVRSRPPEETIRDSSKTEMIPLLSPTMETEMLKESWTIPKLKLNNYLNMEEENNQKFSIWEENFQDLSGWCIDQFPQQYDFPIGEAINSKLTDMNYENDVSIVDNESKELTSVCDKKKTNVDDDNDDDDDILHIADFSNLTSAVKFEKMSNITLAKESDIWHNLITEKTIDTTVNIDIASQTPIASKDTNLKVQLPTQQVTQAKIMDPLEPNVLSTYTSYEPESFDLLSYLCDDEVALPTTSTPSTSQKIIKTTAKIAENTSQKIPNNERQLRKRKESIKEKIDHYETMIPSTSTSSFLPSPSSSSSCASEHSLKKVTLKRGRKPKNIVNIDSEKCHQKKRGPKRKLEIEYSDDEDFSDNSYKESRQKNNQASRKSRMNKKAKEEEMSKRASHLEKDNKILKMKVEELEKLVTSMRMALLQSALKRER
ncbi:uncharacterized protein LOC122512660, partial [Leptopilina heterotoma]|uniref:uncharacterized protein LOC122512660 n=1 Tax=Leptopilina heterotoma TaxID=63436 RepID=UPI001CA9D3A4